MLSLLKKEMVLIFQLINTTNDQNKYDFDDFINNNNFSINAQSKELRSFEKIYQFIHNNNLQKNYLRSLEDNLQDDTTWFYLNKQAAFVEQIAICEESNESPLGPIKVILTSSNIDAIIDWIVYD